ncbi:MAG: DUF2628 domain-containing protein [Hyphomicrobiaceae bacterium]|nr:DUF2628 domain-containing protein [Hyphomicrobiaceae bacterium]
MIGLLLRRNDVVCSVHERPDHAAELEQRAEELVFLRDGFSLPVAILPPVALIYRRAWLATLVYLVLAGSIIVALDALGAGPAAYLLALLMLGITFGFEAVNFQRWSLRTSGWTEVAVVSGANFEECEIRFFNGWQPAHYKTTALPGETSHEPSMLRRLFAAGP